jgi:hypothetical protein
MAAISIRITPGGTAEFVELGADQQAHAAHAQRQAEQASTRQRLVEQPDRKQRAPYRHGVAEDRRASRRQHADAIDGEDVPAGDVASGQAYQLRPTAGGNP